MKVIRAHNVIPHI